MKKILTYLALTSLLVSTTLYASSYTDWRKTGSDQEKLNALVKVVPGTSVHMLQVAERYRNLYWAGKLGKWEFANYQVEEIQEILKAVAITRPKRAESAKEFLEAAFTLFPDAIKNKNQHQFDMAFRRLRSECLSCHAKNDHRFITLPAAPAKSNSLVFE